MTFNLPANSTQGWFARGGFLRLDLRGLTFTPHDFERSIGGRSVGLPLDEITDVGVESPTFQPFNGGLRRRLRVETSDGRRHFFVIGDLDAVVEHTRQFIGGD